MFGTSKKEFWCCKVAFKRGKSLDDVFTVCEAAKVNAVDVIGAFAGILTESRFHLLIKDPASENYFEARDLAEEIAKEKKIKDFTFHETVLGSEKEMKKLETVGQTIFAYCPGLDAVLTLKVKRDTPDGEERRQDMFAVGDIITQKIHEGQQQQTNKIEKKVVEAATVIRDGVGKVLVTQSEVLVAEGRDNKNEIKETVNQRADQQMAFNAKMLEELEQARLDREEAKREMKRMNRLLAAGWLPELEAEHDSENESAPQSASEQLALEYKDRGAEPVLTSPHGPSYERLVEPPSAGSDTLGVTPRTESMDVRRALAPKFSLFGNEQPSPASPQEAAALSPVDAPPPADIASPALAPAAVDDLHVASPEGGVDTTAAFFTPVPSTQPASGSSDRMLEDVRDAETHQKLGDLKPQLASALKNRAKQCAEGTYISPKTLLDEGKLPGKLLGPDEPEPSKKSEKKKKKKNKFFPWA